MERGCIQGLPKFFQYPLLSLRASNFVCTYFDRNKSPLQIAGKVVGCVVRTPNTFQCTHILGHRAVFFVIAQLSNCYYYYYAVNCKCVNARNHLKQAAYSTASLATREKLKCNTP